MKIYLKTELEDTGYIELMRGKYKNKHWSEDSIYFSEDDFVFFELIFAKFNSKYRPLRYTNFDKNATKLIVRELYLFMQKVKINKSAISTLKEMGYDIYMLGNSAISKIDLIPNNEFLSVINELTKWLEKTLQENDDFSVLGL